MKILSHHNSLVTVINAALGGTTEKTGPGPKNKGPGNGVKDMAAGHQSVDAAVAAINKMMLIA